MSSDQEDLADKLGGISLGTDSTDTGSPSQDSNIKGRHTQDRPGSSTEVTVPEPKAPSITGDNQTTTRKAYIPPHKRTKDGNKATPDSTNSTHLLPTMRLMCSLDRKISRSTNMG